MRHLVLVGPMGAGKTTVGRAVADRLGRVFVDTDELVVAASGRSIEDMFAAEGETGFRALERTAVVDACASPAPAVISCGGGAVLDAANRAALERCGIVIWLDAPSHVLAARVEKGEDRPLLASGDSVATLDRIRRSREDAYAAVADLRIDTTGMSIDEVAGAVLAEFGESGEDP